MLIKFNFRVFWSLFNARNKEFVRDRGAVGWIFLFPILMLAGFNYMFNMDNHAMFKVAWIDNTHPLVYKSFKNIKVSSFEDAMEKLEHHTVDLLINKQDNKYNVWLNASSLKSETAYKLLLGEMSAPKSSDLVINRISGVKIKYVDWLLPGLIALNTMWLALWGVGAIIIHHRKLGILKRYQVSPVTALEYLVAQISSRLLALAFSGLILFVGAYLMHPFPIKGSFLDLVIIYLLGCFCLSAIGLIIAARITSEEFAHGILNLITFPFMFLSEVWFSLEGSPEWVVNIAHCSPLWHLTHGMRKILFEGATLYDLRFSIFIFTVITTFGLMAGSLLFKWNADNL